MGCFLACFGSSKDRKRRNQPKNQRRGTHKPLHSTVSPEQDISAISIAPPNKLDEQLRSSPRKKVAFDANVRTYEPVSIRESTEILPESNRNDERKEKSSLPHSLSQDDSITSTVESYPPNHRYNNCRDSDNEEFECEDIDLDYDDEDDDYGDSDEDEDEDRIVRQVSMESTTETYSASVLMEEVDSHMKTIWSMRNARDRSVYVHPVLNPVENLTQWKAVKSKGKTPPLKPQKENFTVDQEVPRISFTSEPIFKQSPFGFKSKLDQSKNQNQEIAIDASLSNWLVSSETVTPTKKTNFSGLESGTDERSMSRGSKSVISIEDRPILGALTVEELKQFSATSSPRRSPSCSPDEMPIIGTVGTYWSHTGTTKDSGSVRSYKGIPNTTSKYIERYL
ncbi:hypothetical protein Acr_13g0009460 [Actinidia rufa]|uniref:Uncharacterized protein n=1 Tax=Actinidia rufa TaxID=165716 RepID=A0A7J0FMF9_9ERIC|nr:hypothetical protein Acr_13g0009460 [Actinidia rufa]